MTQNQRSAVKALYLTTALAALSVAACNKTPAAGAPPPPMADGGPAPLPLDAGAPPTPFASAPVAAALPPAPRVRVSARRDRSRYDYVSRAADINGAFADSPPDYAIDYGGERPTYWRSTNGAYRVVENTPDGERYYYYDAGADQPFLVRDGGYSYGYDQGQLAVVYDGYGRPLPDNLYDAQAERAGRYLSRARSLYRASQERRHESAYAANWDRNRGEIQAQQQQWAQQQQRDADWRAWNDSHAQDQNTWRQEADRRRALDQQRQAPRAGYANGATATGNIPNAGGYGGAPGRDQGRGRPDMTPPPVAVIPPSAGATNDGVARARAQQAQADAQRSAQQASQARAIEQARAQQAQADAAHQRQVQQQDQARVQQAQAQQRAQQTRLQDQARARQTQADAAHQRQVQQQDQVRAQQAQATAARDAQRAQQLQAQERAQQGRMQDQARARQAQTDAAHQRQVQQQDQARAQQAQATAAREAQRTQQLQAQERAQQSRMQEQARAQQARAEAARQHQQQVQAQNAAAHQAQAQSQARAQAAQAQAAEARAAEARARAAAAKPAPAKAPADRQPGDHPQRDRQSGAGGSPNPQP